MMGLLRSLTQKFIKWYYYGVFVFSLAGREYGIRPKHKFILFLKIRRILKHVGALSSLKQHLLLAESMLRVSKSLNGDVVECGCYRGATSATLSLVCALTNRNLYVCDSFEGLPEPRTEMERVDVHAGSTSYYVWTKGEFSCDLDTVKNNIKKYGNLNVCQFVKGYYEDTLKNLEVESIAFVFEDADLASSVEDCLMYLWPKLSEGGRFYCHEPWSEQVVALFYDKKWWAKNQQAPIPGFYGSGRGIMAGLEYSSIGYSEKYDARKLVSEGSRNVHEGSIGYSNVTQ